MSGHDRRCPDTLQSAHHSHGPAAPVRRGAARRGTAKNSLTRNLPHHSLSFHPFRAGFNGLQVSFGLAVTLHQRVCAQSAVTVQMTPSIPRAHREMALPTHGPSHVSWKGEPSLRQPNKKKKQLKIYQSCQDDSPLENVETVVCQADFLDRRDCS